MRLKNGTLFTKKELVGIINALLSIEHGFAKSNYLMKFIEKKQEELFDECEKKIEELKALEKGGEDYIDCFKKIQKEIDVLHKKAEEWNEVIVV